MEKEVGYDGGTGALSGDGNLARVTTEVVDVCLDPFKGLDDIAKTKVGSTSLPSLLAKRPTESAEAVVDRNVDDGLAVVDRLANDLSGIVDVG